MESDGLYFIDRARNFEQRIRDLEVGSESRNSILDNGKLLGKRLNHLDAQMHDSHLDDCTRRVCDLEDVVELWDAELHGLQAEIYSALASDIILTSTLTLTSTLPLTLALTSTATLATTLTLTLTLTPGRDLFVSC